MWKNQQSPKYKIQNPPVDVFKSHKSLFRHIRVTKFLFSKPNLHAFVLCYTTQCVFVCISCLNANPDGRPLLLLLRCGASTTTHPAYQTDLLVILPTDTRTQTSQPQCDLKQCFTIIRVVKWDYTSSYNTTYSHPTQ